ncbi:FAD-dependent oxidoreductase [Streptomyces axinellae]|uniref:FAD-dependent oxidoreductase n=1 Tax=Streptomyces axinellae TaxID=552788 RepID=A0ABN3PS30_9ACTN
MSGSQGRPDGAGDSREQRAVIVGAGIAGVQTAVQLREHGWPGPVRIVGAEPHLPYDRPPLSKAVLLGKGEEAEIPLLEIDFEALGIELELGRTVTGLRPAERLLETDAGPVHYDRLVLATGAEPLTLPGSEGAPGVHLLRTLDDARRLRPVLAARGEIVVVGAGWIGAEFATAARERGCAVTVVEAADGPLPGALPAEVSAPMRAWYEEAGVTLRTGARVASVGRGEAVLADGTRLPADAVVVGIGARPATGWMAGSGITLDDGGAVLADTHLRTSVPGVYAVGDCASFPSARYGRRLLVHHWDNALQGPRTVAANLVAEGHADGAAESVAYDPVPYFWSEQFGRFVQYVGHHGPGDELVWRGNPEDTAWSVCWLREDRPVALLAVGRPRDLAQARKLVQQGTRVDKALVTDSSIALKRAAR